MRFRILIGLLLAAAVGCTPLSVVPQSAFAPPGFSKNGIVLDVLYVRFPPGDTAMNETVWQEIDELHFPPDVRIRLEANGLRAGIISGSLPIELEKRLELKEKPTPDEGPKSVDLERPTTIRRRQLHVRNGKKSNILVLGERERRPELSALLRTDDGRVEGKTYRHVLGLFAARAFPEGDGTVRLEMTPEIEHGEPQKRFVPGDGMFRIEFGPPHEVLAALRSSARLGPGQMLVLSTYPKKAGSLGYQFFTEVDDDVVTQKMLLIRLARTDYDDRFDDAASPREEDAKVVEP